MPKNNPRYIAMTLICIGAAVLLAALLILLSPEAVESAGTSFGKSDPEMVGVVQQGRLPGYGDQPVNKNPQYFCYLIGSSITLDRPDAPGRVMLENTEGNVCSMTVTLELADSGEVIYTSPELQPGEYLEYDLFEKELEKGEYDVTATIFANDPDTGEEKGVFSENIQIIVKNKLF